MPPYNQHGAGQKGPAPLSNSELLARYGHSDPGTDAQRFAEQVHQLSLARRAALGCSTSYDGGEHVVVTYRIEGTDSAGQPLVCAADTSQGALANCLRELNKRYARAKLAEGGA